LDVAIVVVLVASFALLVCAHVALAVGLVLRRPRWRGPLALLVPPLAPYWGLADGLRVRGVLWLAALVLYVLARIAAAF
jgi:hypothetical protein